MQVLGWHSSILLFRKEVFFCFWKRTCHSWYARKLQELLLRNAQHYPYSFYAIGWSPAILAENHQMFHFLDCETHYVNGNAPISATKHKKVDFKNTFSWNEAVKEDMLISIKSKWVMRPAFQTRIAMLVHFFNQCAGDTVTRQDTTRKIN